jgi:hypothetical protein
MMCTTTCHISVDYNLEFEESMNTLQQFATLWSIPYATHTLILDKPQMMWNFSMSESTLIQVNQINVESQNKMHHLFWVVMIFYLSLSQRLY